MPPPQYRNDREYVKKREALKRQSRRNNSPCHLCGKPFDFELPYAHAMAFTADHLDPVGNGGSMTGALAPAHCRRSCNSRRGKKPLAAMTTRQAPKTSRDW
jgi:hypothetical protein